MIAQDTLLVILVKLVDQIPMPPQRGRGHQDLFGSLVLESLGDHDRPSSAQGS